MYFKSGRHIKHHIEKDISEEINEKIAVKVEPNLEGALGFTVTTFKLNGFLGFWGNKVDLSPKNMKAVELSKNKSLLKGLEKDPGSENSDSNYSLSIYHPNNEIEKVILHKHHKNIDIEYLR